jgi:hypothetical protein
MKKVVKRVWAVATGASPRAARARNFMVVKGMYV